MGGADTNINKLAFTKTVLAVLTGITFLAVDTINPVKMFFHTFPSVQPWHIAGTCTLLSIYIFISELKALLYFAVKTFFHSVISIAFRDIEILGKDNIPRRGPLIFAVNHANQFVDGVMLLCTCGNDFNVSYLMAEVSWKRRIVGDLAWALDVVPVKRAQDSALKGMGTISLGKAEGDGTSIYTVTGTDTHFTQQLAPRDKIRPNGTAAGWKVIEVMDDRTVQVDGSEIPETDRETVLEQPSIMTFDILKHVDQKVLFSAVLDKLASGGCIGIFPEGGSHDRTDLLPLKVGVALIAYSALEKDGINVPIIPVGLNYFDVHKWRGRAVVEYGEPIYTDPSTLKDYEAGGDSKRQVCNQLLERIQDSMRSVIVSAPDYDSLQLIHTARRLYQRTGLQGKRKQDMARRFAEGYKRLMTMTDGEPPQDWLDLQERVRAYQTELHELGIRDYQVAGLEAESRSDESEILKAMRLTFQIVHLQIVLVLAAIPVLFINLPVGIMADLYAERRRQKALAKSKVKIKAYDVMLTEKILFCMVAIPSLWFLYGVALTLFSGMDGTAVTLCILSLPLFAYTGIIVSEAGMVDIKDMRPYYMRLFPSYRPRLRALPATRAQLQKDLRAFIKKVGPALGEIYHGKDLDWVAIKKSSEAEAKKDK